MRSISTGHRSAVRGCLTAVAALLAMASIGSRPDAARATSYTYCGASYASGADCYGPRHSLTANAPCWTTNPPNCAHTTTQTEAAAALDVNLAQYGSWVYGTGSACHPYSGGNLLYPWLYNPMGSGQSIQGWAYYGAGEWSC